MLPTPVEDKPNYVRPRIALRERSVLREYWPGILFFVLLDLAFGWWYYGKVHPQPRVFATVSTTPVVPDDPSPVRIIRDWRSLQAGQSCLG
ncbi:MAG: hypothetical protein ACRERZ_00490, partial [Gammaproteobacteria bacterium]